MILSKRSSRDVAPEITNLIILEEEGVPPSHGLGGAAVPAGAPWALRNAIQRHKYLNLWALGDAMGSHFRMTYLQAQALGRNVWHGKTGAISVYYSSQEARRASRDGQGEVERNIRFLRHYIVFKAEQIDGLRTYFYAPAEPGCRCLPPSGRQRSTPSSRQS